MMIIGIDPGITGAIAVLPDRRQPWRWSVYDIPTRLADNQSRSERIVDARRLYQIFRAIKIAAGSRPIRVYLERIHAMKDAAIVAFSMGQTNGTILSILSLLDLDPVRVEPQNWKRFHGLLKSDKDASRQFVLRNFPSSASAMARKKDHNRAESLLIALYGSEIESRS